ncbi:MAG: nitroreductase [Nitrospiraceae bacterium]|nr:nitroreductase [Nitrospiraceae bacterium]
MTLDEILERRYSLRSYDARPVAHGDVVALCEAARQAPSAMNSQTWRFIAVTDPERIARLVARGMGPVIKNKWAAGAPLIIVGCAKLDFMANRLGTRVTGVEYYRIDMGIAMEHMALKATELGLGSCWIGWIDEAGIREVLGIPGSVRVLAMLSVGYAKQAERPPRKRKALNKIAFSNEWGEGLST